MGGTRTYILQLLSFYRRQDAQVGVVKVSTDDEGDDEVISLIKSYGFTVVQMRETTSWAPRRFPFRLLAEVLQYHSCIKAFQPDVVVASVSTPGRFAGVLRSAKRSLYILHSSPYFGPEEPMWKRRVAMLVYRALFGRNHQLLTVSRFSMAMIQKFWGIRAGHWLSAVYNTGGDLPAPCKMGICAPLVVLTLGHVVNYKNPLFWIAVAKKVVAELGREKVKFLWLGEGPLLNECEESVNSEGFSNDIQFLGLKREVADYYLGGAVYFQPSLVESFGLSVLDAMRYGLPCVVANTGGLPELVSDKVSGYVESPYDIDAMAGRIVSLLNSESLREVMGAAGREIYSKKFSPQVWDSSMTEIHDALAGR